MTFMGFTLMDDHCSKGTHHHTKTAAYATLFINSSLTDGLGGADDFAGSILTLLADYGIV
jgi:hypothetical protein